MRTAAFLFPFLHAVSADLSISLPPVLGIDLGNEYTKIAATAPNFPRDMILNSQSQRRSRTCVDFSGQVRTFGEAAYSQQAMRPESVIQYFPSSIGISTSSNNNLNTILNGFPNKYYPYKSKEDQTRKTLLLEVGGRQNLTLSYEDITVNLLSELKEMTKKYLKNIVNKDFESAFVIPVSYTYRQRQLLYQSAATAGLSAVAMIPEPLAAALSHSVDLKKSDLLEQTGENGSQNATVLNKIFLSIGARNLQACLIQAHFIDATNITTKRFHTTDDVVVVTGKGCVQAPTNNNGQAHGTHALDILLGDYFVNKAVKSKTVKQKSLTSRDYRKIVRDSGKVKHTLSTNRESKLVLDSLGDGTGIINESITRETFEELIETSGWFKGISALSEGIQQLKSANKIEGDIHAIELIGGGWRVPRVNAEIAKVFSPIKPSYKCNGDESMAMGAAILAANYSSIYKSKPLLFSIPLNEKLHITIDYKQTDGKSAKEELVYDSNTRLGTSSTRVINTDRDFNVVVTNDAKKILDNISVEGFNQIERTKTNDAKTLEDAKKEFDKNATIHEWVGTTDKPVGSVQVSVTIRLTPNGLITVEKANARWQSLVVQKSPITTTTTSTTTTTPPTTSSSETTGQSNTTASESNSTVSVTPISGTKFVESVQWKTRTLTINDDDMGGLLLDKKKMKDIVYPLPLSTKQMKDAKTLLRSLVKKDQDVEALNEARNRLESEIYAQRSKLEEDSYIARVSSAKERDEILASLSQDEEWLYNEGVTSTLHNVTAKIKNLEHRVYNLTVKALELKNRPKLINKYQSKLKSLTEKVKTLTNKKPWINEEKKANFTGVFDNFTKKFESLIKEQTALKDTDEPVLTLSIIETAWNVVQTEFDLLSKIRKPSNFVMPTTAKPKTSSSATKEPEESTTKSPKGSDTKTANPEL